MMVSPNTCPNCENPSMIQDCLSGADSALRWICEECGYYDDAQVFSAVEVPYESAGSAGGGWARTQGYQSNFYRNSAEAKLRNSKRRDKSLNESIEHIGRALRLPSFVVKEAHDLYVILEQNGDIRMICFRNRLLFQSCCLYIKALNNDIHLTMDNVLSALDQLNHAVTHRKKKLNRILLLIRSYCEIHLNVTAQIQQVCQQIAGIRDKAIIQQVELFHRKLRFLISNWKQDDFMILLFLLQLSQEKTSLKKTKEYEEFCATKRTRPRTKVYHQVVRFIFDALKELAKRMCWIHIRTKQEVPLYLDSFLKYYEPSEKKASPTSRQQQDVAILASGTCSSSSSNSIDLTKELVKDYLYDEELTEKDIPDSEIGDYILSEDEIRMKGEIV